MRTAGYAAVSMAFLLGLSAPLGDATTLDLGDAATLDRGDAATLDHGEAATTDHGVAPAPGRGDAVTPERVEVATPDRGQTATPERGVAPTPDRGEAATPDRGEATTPTRQQLIGAWRLVRISLSDSGGVLVDPFYRAGSDGIIVYDSSGWLSVQIAAPKRPTFAIPASRMSARLPAAAASLRAAAFDTYYSYFGTWELDEATGVVTHHVKSSLIPAETGLSYTQTVTLDGGLLTFTVRDVHHGRETIRRKVWQRIVDAT